jgi:transposase-like protein
VRSSVEETLNALLDAEADRLCNAQRYERSAVVSRLFRTFGLG